MSALSGTSSMHEVTNEAAETVPVPPTVPGEFLVRLGAGWGGPLHELADGLAVWKDGPEAAARVLLSSFEFVRVEAEGVEECRDLLEGLELLRGAVMATGIEAAGVGRSMKVVGIRAFCQKPYRT